MINEIFVSIQGESTRQGRPCFFIRASGCNLRCSYCDTAYAFSDGREMDPDDLFTLVENSGIRLVEITGGEPLLQEETPALITRLLDSGYEVLVETSGSVDIDRADRRAVRVMDVKCPSSGTPRDEVKFVIGGRDDYLWANGIVDKTRLDSKVTVLYSPLYEKLNPKEIAGWILEDKRNVRLQLQLHKIIWGAGVRGV